jgi:hypothetical protein
VCIASCLKIASQVFYAMKNRAKRAKKGNRQIFDAIRKPIAPPGHPLSDAKPDEKARPSLRKAKHKRREVDSEEGGDN